jgi:nucleotide-binding universal stress UspA family protein
MSSLAGTIVAAVDGSASSQEALTWAVEQAQAENRPITLVHAVPRSTPILLDPTGANPQEGRDLSLLSRGHDVLVAAREQVLALTPSVTVDDLCLLEDPRDALIRLSDQATMIVLGSRGRGHMKSLLLGSTAVAVVRHARCPVVVHRPTRPSPSRHGIAVGADATEESLPVLEFAYRQASLRGLPLTVVHSFWYFQQPPVTPTPQRPGLTSDLLRERLALAESLAGFAERYPDVTTHIRIDEGMPERHLLRLADSTDMLIVGAHRGARAEQFMFGSVSVWLVEHAACRVTVVPLSVP